jgi:uncharacterized protein YabN with tetrapyrrole methylase and pyrophosphatase domain
VQKKAAGVGLDPAVVAPDLADAVGALGSVPSGDVVGDLLLAVVGVARANDIDPETALRAAAVRVRDAAHAIEAR